MQVGRQVGILKICKLKHFFAAQAWLRHTCVCSCRFHTLAVVSVCDASHSLLCTAELSVLNGNILHSIGMPYGKEGNRFLVSRETSTYQHFFFLWMHNTMAMVWDEAVLDIGVFTSVRPCRAHLSSWATPLPSCLGLKMNTISVCCTPVSNL